MSIASAAALEPPPAFASGPAPRVAVVHEWLEVVAGSERVLEQILACYPEADLYVLVDFLSPSDRGIIGSRRPTSSFIQRLPFAARHFRKYLPLMPLAVEQFDLSGYDIIISSSHAVAKGVLTGPDQLHVSYVHSPMRYAWDLQETYLQDSGLSCGVKSWAARWMLHRMRLWDYRTANGVDDFIANSHFIARRIRRIYGRTATVIYPPVNVDEFSLWRRKEDYYVAASRLVPYKKMGLIAEAFRLMPDRKLVLIGDGPEYRKVRSKAGDNVRMMGHLPNVLLRDYLQRASALLFAAEEDFGILPVEAQACGTPVIAYGRGGACETIRDLTKPEPTGVLFDRQTPEALVEAIRTFEARREAISPAACRRNAMRFGPDRFRTELTDFVTARWARLSAQLAASRAGASS
jgi:glycosyltransferase involved in cell wall biosynthesis